MTVVSPQRAARELQIRRAARTSRLAFAEAIDVPGRSVAGDDDDEGDEPLDNAPVKLAAHHKLVLQAMDRCSKRNTGRLMIFMPPGSAKSTYASVVFPADYLGYSPGERIILASYGDTLANKMGRRTRSIIKQARYKGIHQTELSADSKASDNFTLTNGSEYMACGILGGVTGNRANGIVIDDPIKGREQANSETIRDKTWDAYQDDLLTRLIPGGWLVLIQTRWHEDDLAGRILPTDWKGESGMIMCKDGNEWEVLCLQAQCEVENDPLGRAQGEYLWPEWFTEKHWNQYKINARTWGALFQQRPTPLDGDLFNPYKIGIIDALPAEFITWVRGWDLAATQGGGAYTVGLKLGRRANGRFIIADVVRGQWGPDNRDAAMLAATKMDGRRVTQDVPDDPGAAGTVVVTAIVKLLVGYPVVWSSESGEKDQRAEPAAAQVNIGNVDMIRADWNTPLIEELRAAPNGKYKDQMDALSRAFARLLGIAGKMRISSTLLDKARR